MEQIKDGMPVFARFFGEVEKLYPGAPEKLQFNEVLRRILDRWVGDLITNTKAQINAFANSEPRSPGRPRPGWADEGVRPYARKADDQPTLDDIRACPRRLVGLSSESETERRHTKDFLHQKLYFSPALDPEKDDAERIITDLFDLWMKHPEKLPESYQEKAEAEPLARIVCDYIAGMTDTYIYEQYEKYCD